MSLNLFERYIMLFSKASSPKSRDSTRATIYTFKKYCKCCGQGMFEPARHDTRIKKKLFKKGFCKIECQQKGPKDDVKIFVRGQKGATSHQSTFMTLDDMVDASKALEAYESKLPPFARMLREVDIEYNLLSEKLSAMELFTGEKWSRSKFYFWLERV